MSGSEDIRAGQWMPIETAPKDGRFIIAGRFSRHNELVWVRHVSWQTAEYYADLECGDPADFRDGWNDDREDECFPTHWMPLPEPPASSNMGVEA